MFSEAQLDLKNLSEDSVQSGLHHPLSCFPGRTSVKSACSVAANLTFVSQQAVCAFSEIYVSVLPYHCPFCHVTVHSAMSQSLLPCHCTFCHVTIPSAMSLSLLPPALAAEPMGIHLCKSPSLHFAASLQQSPSRQHQHVASSLSISSGTFWLLGQPACTLHSVPE